MILTISYADENFQRTHKFNMKRVLKFGVDKALEYNHDILSMNLKKRIKIYLNMHVGRAGYGI